MPVLENEQHEAFALLYAASDFTMMEVAAFLGVPNSTAAQWWAKPEVKERYWELTRARLGKMEVSSEDIIQAVVDIAFDVKVKPSIRLKALDKLGKNVGLFVDSVRVSGGETPVALKHEIPDSIKDKIREIYG